MSSLCQNSLPQRATSLLPTHPTHFRKIKFSARLIWCGEKLRHRPLRSHTTLDDSRYTTSNANYWPKFRFTFIIILPLVLMTRRYIYITHRYLKLEGLFVYFSLSSIIYNTIMRGNILLHVWLAQKMSSNKGTGLGRHFVVCWWLKHCPIKGIMHTLCFSLGCFKRRRRRRRREDDI